MHSCIRLCEVNLKEDPNWRGLDLHCPFPSLLPNACWSGKRALGLSGLVPEVVPSPLLGLFDWIENTPESATLD